MKISKLILFIVFFSILNACSSYSWQKENPNFNHPDSAPAMQNSEPGTTSKYAIYDRIPEVIKRAKVDYPEFMKNISIEGELLLDVEVLYNGMVGNILVLKSLIPGPGGLDEAYINAVKQWEYKPAQYKGKPVSVRVTFPIIFTLD